jgi:CheY-like chemotaxis protein
MDMNDQQFIAALRSILHYLYDPDQLRHNPLVEFFGLNGRVDATSAMQKILLDGIEALKPGDDDPPQSHAWRVYDLLFFRYVRGYERTEVAAQLGISDRQLAREQKTAIEMLAQHLWKANPVAETLEPPAQEAADPGQALPRPWAEGLPAEKPAAWKPVVQSVLDLLVPLALQQQVSVQYEIDADLADLVVPQYALRHALLNLLAALMPAAASGTLLLRPVIQTGLWLLEISSQNQAGPVPSLTDLEHPSIAVARRLLEGVGGRLDLAVSSAGCTAIVRLPAREMVQVVVIDDNPDSLQLFQRYAQGTQYAVTGIQDPSSALRQAERLQPRIILLDVMMPEVDGWEILTRLRQEPWARKSALIICSILPQSDLARSLGADAFLQKPVLPQDFLNLLDQTIKRII